MDIFNPDSVAEEIAKAKQQTEQDVARLKAQLDRLRPRGRHGHPGLLDRNCDQCIQDGE